MHLVQNHRESCNSEKAKISSIPHGAISLKSADISPLEISGYIRFDLTLGSKFLPVEPLEIPFPALGPDIMNAIGQ